MAQIELHSEKPEKKNDETAKGEVSGIIGMIGPQIKGSLAVTFDKDLAKNMMLNMFGEASDEVDDDMRDLVGEMTNMLCGGAKSLLAEQNYQFNMATPVIVSGKSHIIQHKVDGPKILLRFSSDKGNAYLEICFDS